MRINTFHNTLTTQNDVDPLGCVVICRVLDGTLDITTGRHERRSGPGDVSCLTHPDQGCFARGRSTRLQLVGIDLPQQ